MSNKRQALIAEEEAMLAHQAELERQADDILVKDIQDNGFDGSILLDHHMRRRRERELYSVTGSLDADIKPGIFSRPISVADRRKGLKSSTRHED